MQLKYVDLSYSPGKNDLVARYRVEPAPGISLRRVCEYIAGESSIGTWTELSTMNKRIARQLKPNIFSINNKTKEADIAYPAELFEEGNMPQIWSAICGNIFGMKAVKKLRLQDVTFPKSLVKSFKGPKYGIQGIRKLLKVKSRPLVGTIVKPKVGLYPSQHAEVAYESWVGGLDVVKDDENLSSMTFNKFRERIRKTLRARDRAEKETGERKVYMANVTAETEEMKRRAKFVKDQGGEYFMVDIITMGWAALQTMRDYNEELDMVIHGHRAGHAMFTKDPRHGVSMLTVAKCSRLIGTDQLHIGTAGAGKMIELGVEEIEDEIEKSFIHKFEGHALEQNWWGIKPILAVASGGIHPGSIPQVMKTMGKNIVMQFGGGVHGHPMGTRAGAKAVRQALAATLSHIPLKDYAKAHLELREAISKWGV